MTIYWGSTLDPSVDKIFLLPSASKDVIVAVRQNQSQYSPHDSLYYMGPCTPAYYKSIESAARLWLGFYVGHMEISIEEYEALYRSQRDCQQADWIWFVTSVSIWFSQKLRSINVSNQPIQDHENNFLGFLGFNEFYTSRHIVMQTHGHLPPLREGDVERTNAPMAEWHTQGT